MSVGVGVRVLTARGTDGVAVIRAGSRFDAEGVEGSVATGWS